jgi:1-aminocyclopropane-1-carboxylate deaminase/D-cysteine desulfhydrase-like pyridoxal-dependent ACC family enzyme
MSAVPPRIPLALAPTPILKLDRLSRRLGVELYVKRDDLTGLLESGNKVRKLEFLVGEALSLAPTPSSPAAPCSPTAAGPCPRWRPGSA